VLIVDKLIAFATLKRKAKRFEKSFWSGRSLEELYAQHQQRTDQPFTAVFVAALREWKRSFEGGTPPETQLANVKDRVEKAMNISIQRELEKIERGLGYLATVGSTAPFVGLFGTVWGIMTAFTAIAARNDTTLAVVAPGIADALFATALGLVAAIPAVIAYNRFVNELGRYTGRLEIFADEFSTFLSRQLDEKAR
jgi:biopolymer transport protein TolQ